MATCKISSATAKGKAWKAECSVNGKKRTIQGGQDTHKNKWGTKGGKSEGQVKSFNARHGKPTTAKKYINKLNWDSRGSRIGKTVQVPNRLFKK